jgi:hypothetical protein
MSSSVDLAVIYRIANAPLRMFPFPHLFVRDIFPASYYAALQAQLPAADALPTLEQARGTRGYPDRFVMMLGGELPGALTGPQREFWRDFARWILGGRFAQAVLNKFEPFIEPRVRAVPEAEVFDEAMLVHDRTNYALGPHTDSPAKLASLLFYLPADGRMTRHGTSIYVPKDPYFTCPGGPHHDFAGFERMATMPFEPNSLFAFPKSSASFHGVEPIAEAGVRRNMVLYDLRMKKPA